MRHVVRPKLDRFTPVLVTMRAVRNTPSMRAELVANVVLHVLAHASRNGFRVLQYSVQKDHMHLVAEADDGPTLSRGMQWLASRIALAVNNVRGRRGALWRERYHRQDLTSPRQFRNALVYVLFNARKHAHDGAERAGHRRSLDLCSSAVWFDDWAAPEILALVRGSRAGPRPVALPTSWIARTGWKRHGLLLPTEAPKELRSARPTLE